jgi:hypothetical protein
MREIVPALKVRFCNLLRAQAAPDRPILHRETAVRWGAPTIAIGRVRALDYRTGFAGPFSCGICRGPNRSQWTLPPLGKTVFIRYKRSTYRYLAILAQG